LTIRVIHLITGAAGFIGSHLVSALLSRGHNVVAFDSLTLGNIRYLETALASGRCTFRQIDCANLTEFRSAVGTALDGCKCSTIWHLAANSDIPAGIANPHIDLRDTFMTTFNALLVMREFAIPDFHFASSSAVYGDFGGVEISEHAGPCQPISNYGAMKLASEGQICAALESQGRKASIFRFPNVVGAPATHGVILDFINKLRADRSRLPVLGDGTQQKSYLHVDDLVAAMLFIAEAGRDKINLYNIGPRDAGVTVRFIAEYVRDVVAPGAEISYGHGDRGWVGDIPRFRYATNRLVKLGWQPRMDSEAAVCRAVRDIAGQLSS
jgi:UDP-glucose 4-epimerase